MSFLPEWTSDISVIVTIIGFGVTIYQVVKLRSTAEAISSEVKATQHKMQKTFAISDIARICEIINIINVDFSRRNLEMAHNRMQEVNNLIIELKEVPALQWLEATKDLNGRRRFLANDLVRLQNAIYVNGEKIDDKDISSMISNLTTISELLLKLNSQLKNRPNG